jgi:hypothetical protein
MELYLYILTLIAIILLVGSLVGITECYTYHDGFFECMSYHNGRIFDPKYNIPGADNW